MKTVKLGYASNKNISFKGQVDTKIPQDEWDEMSESEQEETINDLMADIVDVWVVEE